MKKNLGKVLALILAFVLVIGLAPVYSVHAEETAQTWEDDFGSGKGGNYTPHGWWWNMDGVLTVGDERAGAGVCYYWLNDYVWDDFVMEFDVLQQSAEFGVIFRAQKTTADDCQNQGYGLLSDTNYAFFMAETGGWSNFTTMRNNGWANNVEVAGEACPAPDGPSHWKIVARGSRIEVYFNHSETPNMAMSANLYESGAIGFRTNNPGGAITAVVDNLKITAITDGEEGREFSWEDDFSSGKGPSYTPHGYWWNMDGKLTVGDPNAAPGVCYYWLNNYIWKDFVMEFDVTGQSSEFGVILRAQKTTGTDCQNHGYGVLSDTNWVFFMAETGGWSGFDTLKREGYAKDVPNVGSATPAPTGTVHWKIVAKGDRIEVYFNGSETPNMAMDATLYGAGAIGFRTNNPGGAVTAVVNNLKISGTILNPCEHTQTEIRNAKEANCTETGYTGDTYCKECGELVTEGTSIEAKGHTPGAEATCTEAQVCTVCSGVLTPATGHDYKNGVCGNCGGIDPNCAHASTEIRNAKEATCTENGYTGDVYCLHCGELATPGEVIEAKGHTAGVEATCTTAQVCTVCNETLAPAKGHTPGAAATCTEPQKCTVCRETLAPATGHDYANGTCGNCGAADPNGAPAAKPGQKWEDDFGSDKGGYYTPYGYWWNMDGQLTVGDKNAMKGVCYYWLKDMVWDDFVMEFDVLEQHSEFGVILRAQKTTDMDCQNYGYGVLSDTNWAFFMAENGKFSNFDTLKAAGLASNVGDLPVATPGSTGATHWKIVAKGNRIEVYFNHAETPNMVMESSLWSSGAIGFRTNNPGGAITAVVDNLTITSLNNPPQTGDPMEATVALALGLSAAALAVLLLNKPRFF